MRGGPINTRLEKSRNSIDSFGRLVDEEPDDNCVPVDELTETENAFAVLFVKDGEKVNFVRVSVTNDETATTSTPFEQPQQATVSNSNPDSMRALENRRTFQVF